MSRISVVLAVVLVAACNKKDHDVTVTKQSPSPSPKAAVAPAAAPAPKPQPAINAVKPPSTGHEMPADQLTMKPEQARAIVTKVLAAAAGADRNCEKALDALVATLPVAFPKMEPDAAPAYKLMQTCALETKRWRAAIQAGVNLLQFDPDTFNVVQIVRALAEMGEYDQAIAAAKELAKKFPKWRTR